MAKCNSIRNIGGYAAVLAAVLAGCAALAPQVERWQPAPVGASWETAQRNTGRYEDALSKVTVREGTWKGSPSSLWPWRRAAHCSSNLPTANGSHYSVAMVNQRSRGIRQTDFHILFALAITGLRINA